MCIRTCCGQRCPGRWRHSGHANRALCARPCPQSREEGHTTGTPGHRDTECPLLSTRLLLTLNPSPTQAQLRLQDSGADQPGRPRPFLSGDQPMRPRGWYVGPARQAQPCAGSPASSSPEYQPMRTRGQSQGWPGNGKGRGVFRRSLLRPGPARAEEPTKQQPWQSPR